jgi:hypothetical protein
MATWEDAQKRSEAQKLAGGTFLRLADHGEKFIGAFVGNPHFHDFVWNPTAERYDEWTAEAEAAGKKKVTRYSMNIYVLKIGLGKEWKSVPAAEAVKIWECNNQVFSDVLKVKEKYGLDKWFFEVERNGKKGNSKTTYSVLPETKLDDEQMKIIAGLKLHDLAKAGGDDDDSTDMASHDKAKANGITAAATPAAPAAAAPATSPAPEVLDPEAATKLIGRLKALPREKIEEFLVKFSLKQVRALKRTDLPAAEAWIALAEGPAAAVDPFA